MKQRIPYDPEEDGDHDDEADDESPEETCIICGFPEDECQCGA